MPTLYFKRVVPVSCGSPLTRVAGRVKNHIFPTENVTNNRRLLVYSPWLAPLSPPPFLRFTLGKRYQPPPLSPPSPEKKTVFRGAGRRLVTRAAPPRSFRAAIARNGRPVPVLLFGIYLTTDLSASADLMSYTKGYPIGCKVDAVGGEPARLPQAHE